jgi:hypothetical protein
LAYTSIYNCADLFNVLGCDAMSIVERLNERAQVARGEETGTGLGDAIHFEEAAATITALREALKPFADEADEWLDAAADDASIYPDPLESHLKVGHFRAARKAYEDSQ